MAQCMSQTLSNQRRYFQVLPPYTTQTQVVFKFGLWLIKSNNGISNSGRTAAVLHIISEERPLWQHVAAAFSQCNWSLALAGSPTRAHE
jgi:hypothetical protein